MLHVFRTTEGMVVCRDGEWMRLPELLWDEWFQADSPIDWLNARLAHARPSGPLDVSVLAPVVSQEVWAAGVTYYRSRSARMEESDAAADCYDRVYAAERPELFFKATPHRVVGTGGSVRIRRDATWNVPEPELAVCVSRSGRIFGYTIGNDMSSRDLEGQNPLYLPQAKVYDQCCALGPGILVDGEPLPPATVIELTIVRDGAVAFSGSTQLSQMKRTPEELVGYLFRDNSFPAGCLLLTGTGVVPDADFTLAPADEIDITIEPIGTLKNRVIQAP
ncbi:MAG: 2-hydroxyhepta-2,4-diene-1,7-dioate isomerase [Planctomycetaceae bacterium]|nr:2-hydroxyhepta-2,4-diene-1,7-dioate isomerase [Planctomycetaceae bacterium]